MIKKLQCVFSQHHKEYYLYRVNLLTLIRDAMLLQGSNVLERSSELIHSGELTRIVRQGKMQQRSFFLFDHQLVFCKKDVLRRDLLHYRGRLDMDQTEVLDVPDGRDLDLGLTLKNALRLRNASTLEFVCMLCCRKAQDKERWLEAFVKERCRVKEDQEMGESCWIGSFMKQLL